MSLLHVVIRSATPQLSKKVLSLTDGNHIFENALISFRPILMIAAYTHMYKLRKPTTKDKGGWELFWGFKSFKLTFVLFPISKPSAKPVTFASNFLIIHRNYKKWRTNCRYCTTIFQTCSYGHYIFQSSTEFDPFNIFDLLITMQKW